MYQKYQTLVKQFILKAINSALYQLCQASAEKHLEITWATEQSNRYKYTFSYNHNHSVKGNEPPLVQI